jgi:DNA-binding transcriptional LysR family regulator
MDLFHVSDFIKLAESRNFSIAADELFLTQPTLSKHIKSLEKTLGVKLFIRNTKQLRLSEAGKYFLPQAKELEQIYQKAKMDIHHYLTKNKLELTLAYIPAMTFYNILDEIAVFKEQNPGINIILSECHYFQGKGITEALQNFEYDMAFCDSYAVQAAKCELIEYCEDELAAVLYRGHPLASLKKIDLRLLAGETFVLLNESNPTYFLSMDACKKAGFVPKIFFLGSRIENVLECISENMGIGLLMKNFISISQSDNLVARKIVPTSKRHYVLARALRQDYSPASRELWDYISGIVEKKPQRVEL